MKAKLLSFAYVYFLESGLFNGLQAIQIKKFLALVSGCVQPQFCRRMAPRPTAVSIRSMTIVIARVRNFGKKMYICYSVSSVSLLQPD
jgi:hypothetical protein